MLPYISITVNKNDKNRIGTKNTAINKKFKLDFSNLVITYTECKKNFKKLKVINY